MMCGQLKILNGSQWRFFRVNGGKITGWSSGTQKDIMVRNLVKYWFCIIQPYKIIDNGSLGTGRHESSYDLWLLGEIKVMMLIDGIINLTIGRWGVESYVIVVKCDQMCSNTTIACALRRGGRWVVPPGRVRLAAVDFALDAGSMNWSECLTKST